MINKNTQEFIMLCVATVMILGFIGILWIVGVENSKEYTWWYLLHLLGGR